MIFVLYAFPFQNWVRERRVVVLSTNGNGIEVFGLRLRLSWGYYQRILYRPVPVPANQR